MKKTIELVFEYVSSNEKISYQDLKGYFSSINESTLVRNLNSLLKNWKIKKEKEWKNTFYFIKTNIEKYFDTPIWERKKILYNLELLKNYKPNETYFFNKQNLHKLERAVKDLPIDTDFYKTNKRFLETLLIDLSYASSYLEWNTYSYLDTEVLLKYNEINKEKTKEETQMILNHKKAIEYMIFYKKKLKFNKKTFFEIHSLLWERILLKDELWIIRNHGVEITWSTYKPLDIKLQLEQEFEIFLKKLNKIKNPFEQSLFIMTFIPYFQLFLDVNKRTSRILWNLPLIKNNLPVLSLIQIEMKKYILSILSIYELNDIDLLQNIWTENYLLNLEKYKRYLK